VQMHKHIRDEFEDRARKGDGLFAIAFALLELAGAQQSTAEGSEEIGRLREILRLAATDRDLLSTPVDLGSGVKLTSRAMGEDARTRHRKLFERP
jgi:hypothetical protein